MEKWIDSDDAEPFVEARNEAKQAIIDFDIEYPKLTRTPEQAAERHSLVALFEMAKGELRKAENTAKERYFRGLPAQGDEPAFDPLKAISD